jgi:hypothetical protein
MAIISQSGDGHARPADVPVTSIPESPDPPPSPGAEAPRRDDVDSTPKRAFGSMKGELDIPDEFFDPLPAEELALWEQDGDGAGGP